MTRICILLIVGFLAGCGATIQNYRILEQSPAQLHTASVGSTIFRLNRQSDLPNAFGKSDIFGGKVDRGYAELKFHGLTERGELILSVNDIQKSSTETTMDRYSARPRIDVQTTVSTGSAGQADGTRFLFEVRKQKELVISGVRVTFVEIQPYSVTYRLEDTQR